MSKTIRRPPLDFVIDGRLEDAINDLVDAIETKKDEAIVAVLEEYVFAMSRTLPDGSSEERWVIDYYCNGGWANG